jgi:hypothetical protein
MAFIIISYSLDGAMVTVRGQVSTLRSSVSFVGNDAGGLDLGL